MPMPSFAGPVLRWPRSEQVIDQTTAWATAQRQLNPDVLSVGVFGSYGRGDAGVGSDLDLLLILEACDLPIWERLRRWDTSSLPLACDLLVYSRKEWQSLPQWNPRLVASLSPIPRQRTEVVSVGAIPSTPARRAKSALWQSWRAGPAG